MSDSTKRYGVEFDVRTGKSYPYYEQDLDYSDVGGVELRKTGSETTANLDQNGKDRDAAICRFYDAAAFLALEQAKTPVGLPTKLTLGSRLPPTLTAISIRFNKSAGAGTSDHLATDMFIAIEDVGSGTLDPKSSAQASASIVPIVSWTIDNWQADAEIDAVVYEFIDSPGLNPTQIKARMALAPLSLTLTDFPVFKKKSIQFELFGSQVSIQQAADSQASISVNIPQSTSSGSKSKGFTSSKEVGTSVRVETTPEVIHNGFNIGSGSANVDSQAVTITVKANIPDVPNSGTPVISAYTNEPTSLSGTANAAVTFSGNGTTLSATSPAAIPITGLGYLYDSTPDDLGTVKYRVTVWNWNQYV